MTDPIERPLEEQEIVTPEVCCLNTESSLGWEGIF